MQPHPDRGGLHALVAVGSPRASSATALRQVAGPGECGGEDGRIGCDLQGKLVGRPGKGRARRPADDVSSRESSGDIRLSGRRSRSGPASGRLHALSAGVSSRLGTSVHAKACSECVQGLGYAGQTLGATLLKLGPEVRDGHGSRRSDSARGGVSLAQGQDQEAGPAGARPAGRRPDRASTCADIFDTLLQRERLGSTGVGRGIAIPHGRVPALEAIVSVFARLEEPIDFEALDNEPVDLIFLLLAPEHAGADHLKALARISRLLREPASIERLRAPGSRRPLLGADRARRPRGLTFGR